MTVLNVHSHFDTERIQLDAPVEPGADAKLLVTVPPEDDEERGAWTRFSLQGLERAYGDDEPEYSLSDVKVPNLDGR